MLTPGASERALTDIIYARASLEAGDLAGALPRLRAMLQAYRTDDDVRYVLTSEPCLAGLSFGLSGDIEAARSVIKPLWRYAECRTYFADIVAARGTAAQADAAYARAIRPAPSLPQPYQHWGMALLKRNDTVRAEAMFRKANALGPRWADPLKSLGDLAASRGE